MKFNKSKFASVIMSGVLAVNVVTPAFAINNENTTTKSSTSTISSQTTTDSDSTNKVWVVDQKEEDVQVLTGYRYYYICNNCGQKFYFDQYPRSDEDVNPDEAPGERGAAAAANDHLIYSSCAGATKGTSAGKDPIYKTEHHEEIGHYEEITVDQNKLTVKYNKYNEFGDYSEESVDYTSTSDTNAKFVMRHNGTAYPSVTVTPDGDITWKSSDKSVATAASSGEIRAYNLGTTTITATSPNGAYVTFDVEIVPNFTWNGTSCVADYAYAGNGSSSWDYYNQDCDITSKVTKPATCSHTGETVYTASITVGGKTYTDTKTVETPKTETHSWNEGEITTQPTCTKNGVKTYTCTECRATKTELVPATGHTYGEPTFKWSNDKTSCTASVSCKAGDDTQTANCKVSSKVTTEATCAKEGVRTYTATVTLNGKDYTDTKTEKIAKTENHSWDEGKITTQPTDTREGVKTYTCTVCGKTKTEAIPKLNAEYKEPTFAWSSDYTSCVATFVCTTGGSDLKQDCEVTHKTTKNPTCTKTGVETYTATVEVNGKTYTDVKTKDIPATGHTYGEPKFKWSNDKTSCTASVSCKAGDDTQTANCKVSSKVTTEATCAKEGVRTYTATVTLNGKNYTDTKTEKIAKTENHSWDEGKITTQPTDTREGVKTYTCTVCGKTKTEAIPKLNAEYKEPTFAWSSDYTSCVATFVCTTGGSDLKQDCEVTHKTTEATCETAGTTKHTATITFNGKTYTDVKETAIPATGHTYGEPEFNWNGTQSCVATFTCAKCGKTNDVNAKIEKSGSGMKVTYTATVTADGKTYTDQKADKRFVDVADDAYYYDAVDYALKHKITDGTSETTFSPDDNCTRAQIVQFLYNLDARNTEALIAETIPFHDIEDDAWYADAVKWAYENQVTDGTSETTFSPDESCTRAQVVQFLWNRAGNPEPKNVKTAFTDVPEDAWYAKAVAWAAENGITSGTSETTFSPDDNCTRAQIVTLIYHNETM